MKKIKQYSMYSNNPEMILIYKRFNDLRKLNLHFINERNKYILDQNVFNSMYFNFKNKLLNKSRIKIEKKRLNKTPLNSNYLRKNLFFNNKENKIRNNESLIISNKNSFYIKYNSNNNSNTNNSNNLSSTRTGGISFNNNTSRNNNINVKKMESQL